MNRSCWMRTHPCSIESAARLLKIAVLAAISLLWIPSVAATEVSPGESDDVVLRAEYGVVLALGGETDRAERVFVSLLSEAPGHPTALNNLGNLHLIRGNVEVALAFYWLASQVDSTDAGIVLNRSIALMLSGDEAAAASEANLGLRMAGGVGKARSLLGLPGSDAGQEQVKAADGALLTREEVQALLDAAVLSVPADTTAAASGDTTAGSSDASSAETGEVVVWRSAGPRAIGESEIPTVLYWKR